MASRGPSQTCGSPVSSAGRTLNVQWWPMFNRALGILDFQINLRLYGKQSHEKAKRNRKRPRNGISFRQNKDVHFALLLAVVRVEESGATDMYEGPDPIDAVPTEHHNRHKLGRVRIVRLLNG